MLLPFAFIPLAAAHSIIWPDPMVGANLHSLQYQSEEGGGKKGVVFLSLNESKVKSSVKRSPGSPATAVEGVANLFSWKSEWA